MFFLHRQGAGCVRYIHPRLCGIKGVFICHGPWHCGLISCVLFCIPVFALLRGTIADAEQLMVLEPQKGPYNLFECAGFLKDYRGDITIQEVAAPSQAGPFQSAAAGDLSHPPNSKAYWLRFTVIGGEGPSPGPNGAPCWLLDLGWPQLSAATLYTCLEQPGSPPQWVPVLDIHSRESGFTFSLPVSVHEPKTFYLRVQGSGRVLAPFDILSVDAYARKVQIQIMFFALYYGVVIGIALFNLYTFVTLRDKAHFWFTLFTLFIVLYFFFDNGMPARMGCSPELNFTYHGLMFSGMACVFCAVQFTRSFLCFLRTSRLANTALLALGLSCILVAFCSLFVGYGLIMPIGTVLLPTTVFSLCLSGYYAWRQGFHPARFHITAWAAFSVGILVRLLSAWQLINFSFPLQMASQSLPAICVLLLAYALADRYRIEKQQQEQTRADKERIERENALHQLILNNSILGIAYTHAGKIEWTNSRLAEIFKADQETFQGGLFSPFFPSFSAYEAFQHAVDDALANRRMYDQELELLAGGGRRIWCRFVGRPVGRRESQGGTLWLVEEITDRRAAQFALQQSEERYRLLVEHSNDFLVIMSEDGAYQYVSDSIERITGFKVAEKLGKRMYDYIHPSDYSRVCRLISISLKQPGVPVFAEYRHRTANRGWVYLEAVATNMLDKPSVNGIVINVRDITERKRMDEALRLSEERYRMLVESIPYGILEMDTEGRILFVNPAHTRMYGYSLEEIRTLTVFDLIADESHREWLRKDLAEHIIQPMPIASIVDRGIAKDGHNFWVQVDSIFKRDAQGATIGFVSVISDITQRKQAEEEREKLIVELQDALSQIKTLHGLLPICASCKKIRDDAGYWNNIESYISERSDAAFTHSICPDCARRIYPELHEEESPGPGDAGIA